MPNCQTLYGYSCSFTMYILLYIMYAGTLPTAATGYSRMLLTCATTTYGSLWLRKATEL